MPVWRSIYRLKQFTEHLRYVIQNAFTGLLTWCANYNVHKGEIIVVLLDSTTSGYITGPKGGFPFSGKSRAIDFLRLLSFEIQAIKRNGWVDCTHLKRKWSQKVDRATFSTEWKSAFTQEFLTRGTVIPLYWKISTPHSESHILIYKIISVISLNNL
jgi:hypothetical protein